MLNQKVGGLLGCTENTEDYQSHSNWPRLDGQLPGLMRPSSAAPLRWLAKTAGCSVTAATSSAVYGRFCP